MAGRKPPESPGDAGPAGPEHQGEVRGNLVGRGTGVVFKGPDYGQINQQAESQKNDDHHHPKFYAHRDDSLTAGKARDFAELRSMITG